MMKKVFLLMVVVLLMTACATSEERAARQAENMKMLKASVGNQKYRISINQMTPKRGLSKTVSGHWLRVDSNTVTCSLPYAGRDDIPHMKTRSEARVHVIPDDRDYIDYEGTVSAM